MKIAFYAIAAVLGFLGFVFIVGSQGILLRIMIGIILFVAAGGMVYLSRLQPQHIEMTQKIDLSGDVNLQSLKCQSCGATLTDKSLSVKGGAIFVNCEYCGSTYQLEEEVKW